MRRSTPQIPAPLAALALREVPAPPESPTPPEAPAAPKFPTLPPSEIAKLDAELYRLSRGAGRLRLRIGQALHRLAEGIHELGFSTLGAYALERCNRGGRWAAETRTLGEDQPAR